MKVNICDACVMDKKLALAKYRVKHKTGITMLNFVALDFETANAANDRACSIGLVKVDNSRVVAQEYRLINPEVPIWWYFTKKVHGLGDRDVQDEPCFDKVWKSLRPLLKGCRLYRRSQCAV